MRGILIFVLCIAAVGAAIGVVAAGVKNKRVNIFKTQAGAWLFTVVMVIAAIGIGYAKAPAHSPDPRPDYPSQTIPPAASNSCVWDNARVLSDKTVRTLDQRNDRLWDNYGVSIGVVTCNYGGDDLYDYALQCAGDMGLNTCDMIVVLDIQGSNYWLVQGADMTRDFTDQDCSDYAYDYMERPFAKGDYDKAVLELTEALEAWYGVYYG